MRRGLSVEDLRRRDRENYRYRNRAKYGREEKMLELAGKFIRVRIERGTQLVRMSLECRKNWIEKWRTE